MCRLDMGKERQATPPSPLPLEVGDAQERRHTLRRHVWDQDHPLPEAGRLRARQLLADARERLLPAPALAAVAASSRIATTIPSNGAATVTTSIASSTPFPAVAAVAAVSAAVAAPAPGAQHLGLHIRRRQQCVLLTVRAHAGFLCAHRCTRARGV